MNLEPITLPTDAEILNLLSVADLKGQQRVRHSLEDDIFEGNITDAYRWFDGPDGWLGRSILTQQWVYRLCSFSDEIEIPIPPLISIAEVKYYDSDNAEQTLAATVFNVQKSSSYGKIVRAKGEAWPSVYDREDAVSITFNSGYGDAASVQQKAGGIRRGMILLAGHFYRNREETYAEPRLVQVPRDLTFGMKDTAGRYRLPLLQIPLKGAT